MENNNTFTDKSVLVCTQHTLTEEQLKDVAAAKQLHFLKTQAPELFAQVANIDPEIEQIQLQKLAFELAELAAQYEVVILPIGSPELQFSLAIHLSILASPEIPLTAPTVVFARTRREVFKHAGWGSFTF